MYTMGSGAVANRWPSMRSPSEWRARIHVRCAQIARVSHASNAGLPDVEHRARDWSRDGKWIAFEDQCGTTTLSVSVPNLSSQQVRAETLRIARFPGADWVTLSK